MLRKSVTETLLQASAVGNDSFAIVRVTRDQLDVLTCRWLDDSGNYELVGPFLSAPTDDGAAP